VALFCLCWHLLLPLLINLGIAPVIYGLSEHCRPVLMTTPEVNPSAQPKISDKRNADQPVAEMAMNDMAGMDMSHMDMHQMTMQSRVKPAAIDEMTQISARKAHIHEVMTLAAKIMKHCPLCSHGLEGGLLAALVVLSLILLLLQLIEHPALLTLYRAPTRRLLDHLYPPAQAPPVLA